MIYRYDKNSGDIPVINDNVEVCHTNSPLDGKRAKVIGFHGDIIAIIKFETPYDMSGATGLGMSVVCLKKY